MTKIAHLTSVHARYDTRIFLKECRYLAAAGHNVTLVVADGKGDETRDGVSIIDVGKPNGRLTRMSATVNKVYRVAAGLDADVYHLHDPELLRIARRLKRIRHEKVKVLYDVHEDYTSSIRIKPYLPGLLGRGAAAAFEAVERHVVRNIDGVVLVIDEQVGYFRKYAKRYALVPNFVDTSLFPDRRVDFGHARILHAGSLTEARGLHEMIKLANRLNGCGEIALAGRLSGAWTEAELGSARYLGVLGESGLLAEYMLSNIGLILYRAVGQYGKATAVKVFEYMAAGMPVIVPDHGDWPALVQRAGCGIAVNIDDVEQQIKAVEFLLSNPDRAREMGRNGRDYARAHASWAVAFEALALLYAEIKENSLLSG